MTTTIELNRAVAEYEGRVITSHLGGAVWVKGRDENGNDLDNYNFVYAPSTDWAQGGPIIARENIVVCPPALNAPADEQWWYAQKDRVNGPTAFWCGKGETPLIAAMRCYVASKMGNRSRWLVCRTKLCRIHKNQR